MKQQCESQFTISIHCFLGTCLCKEHIRMGVEFLGETGSFVAIAYEHFFESAINFVVGHSLEEDLQVAGLLVLRRVLPGRCGSPR